MRLVDLDYAIIQYNNENNIQYNLWDNKYLLLDADSELYSFEISGVDKECIWLKPVEETSDGLKELSKGRISKESLLDWIECKLALLSDNVYNSKSDKETRVFNKGRKNVLIQLKADLENGLI